MVIGFSITWCLPYSYTILATCDPIKDWLLQMCGGDEQLVQLMRAYLLGVVTSRVDWQKYLELIGPGGTGKSTFIRLAIRRSLALRDRTRRTGKCTHNYAEETRKEQV